MRPAPEYAGLTGPGNCRVYRWEAYDPASRVDLSTSAVAVGDEMYFIDPIPLVPPALAELLSEHRPAGIIVTNGNHARAAEEFRLRHRVPLCLHEDAGEETGLEADIVVPRGGGAIFDGVFECFPISGGAAGEMAVRWPDDGGWLVVGDALINLPSHPFCMLPAKYCADPAELRCSLGGLLKQSFERLLFAHGEPILVGARQRLTALLADSGGKR